MVELNVRYDRNIKKTREINVEEGELVLVVHEGYYGCPSVTLGVFSTEYKIAGGPIEQTEKGYFHLWRALLLDGATKLGGIKIPIIEHRKYKFSYKEDERGLLEFHAGKEEIVGLLKKLPGFEMHAEWVSRLEKPYLR